MNPDPLERSIVFLLSSIPETWHEFNSDALSEPDAQALFLLVAAGMVERRFTIRLRLFGHDQVIEGTIAATGEYGMVEAMEHLAAGAWQDWRSTFEQRPPGAPAFHSERIGREEWRLTSDGIQARADALSGEPAAFDFILRRGPLADRPAVRGRGSLVRFEKVTPQQPATGDLPSWEGEELLSDLFVSGKNPTGESDGDTCGPERDEHDDRYALWFGKRLYLGRDTETFRLFWLMASPVGRACSRHDIEKVLDGSLTTDYGTAEESRKAWQRIRKAISKLKERLRDAEMDVHILVVRGGSNADPEYSMIRRFPNKNL